MSTRSLIAIKNDDETYDAVYCHFDGYPEAPGVGHKLKQHYTSEEQIRELLAAGNMSSLGEDIKKCEFYSSRGMPVTFYKNLTSEQLKERAQNSWCEYIHIFEDKKWTHIEL
jgi:hypothetical protein